MGASQSVMKNFMTEQQLIPYYLSLCPLSVVMDEQTLTEFR